jgi:hypothetical protein
MEEKHAKIVARTAWILIDKYAKNAYFYEQWSNLTNCSPSANELQRAENEQDIPIVQLLNLICSPAASKLDLRDFFSLSFTHHCEILSQTKTLEGRDFFA